MTKQTRIRKKDWPLGVRGQLLAFISGVTLFTLLLLWLLVSRFLQPLYNRTIRVQTESRVNAIVSRIDAFDAPIAQRDFWGLTLNNEFWSELDSAIQSGQLNVDRCCVDISDATCRSIAYVENLFPCALHEASGGFFSPGGAGRRDTSLAVQLRKELFESESGTLYQLVEGKGSRQMAVGKVSADGSVAVIVSVNLAQIDTAGEVIGRLLPLLALLLLVVDVAAAFLFSRWFTRPLVQMADAARTIASGNYTVEVPENRRDELGLLGREFNHMSREVRRSAELQRELLANVSHDLRTPLTLIRGYAETVRDITGNDDARRTEQCSIIVDETNRLSALVNSVMELSKVSSGAQKPERVRFDLSQLCSEVAERYEALCEQNGWALHLEADHECMVCADPAMLERVLHNLLGNAMNHLGPDGVFVLRAIPQAHGCRVEVEDHGSGVAAEDLPYLFDRYYRSRSDSGRTGTGLGLSITKAILQQHNAAFGVDSQPGAGTIFWFELPDSMPQQ